MTRRRWGWFIAGVAFVAAGIYTLEGVAAQLGWAPAAEPWKGPVAFLLLAVGILALER